MGIERTLSILKPDATKRNITGAVNKMIEESGLTILAQKKISLSEVEAKEFYAVHKERSFFNELVKSMMSGPVVVQVLEGDSAVSLYRGIMGATNPSQAAEGTIRKVFGENVEANSVHGSDSLENAAKEISFFFSGSDLARLTK